MTDEAEPSSGPWRPDDIVAFEEMRDLAVAAQTLLIARARRGGTDSEIARSEATTLHRETIEVDGFDRKAIDAQTRRLALRLLALRGEEREIG